MLPSSLSEKQQPPFDIILCHSVNNGNHDLLKMIIQGTTLSSKSFLIHCISHALSTLAKKMV